MNTSLFAGCCYLIANIANSIFAAALTPDPAPPSSIAAPPSDAAKRSWADREVILSRNLFNSSTLVAKVEAEVETEELEATKLPLTLLGTASATDDLYSWAAIKDRDAPNVKILRVGDEVRPNATVMRIERRRVVLDENGLPRELVLAEKDMAAAYASNGVPTRPRTSRRNAGAAPRRGTPRRPPAPSEARNLGANMLEIPRSEVDEALNDPGDLLRQARFMPEIDEEGQMIGLQVRDPKPGSIFERAGISSGDVISEINGIKIDSAERSREVLSSLEGAPEIEIVVLRNGESVTKTLSFSTP